MQPDDHPRDRAVPRREPDGDGTTRATTSGTSRRAVLKLAGAGAVSVGGASFPVGAQADDSAAPEEAPLEDYELRTNVDLEAAVEDDPTVVFDGDELVVRGAIALEYGNCETAGVESLTYDETASTLTVEIAPTPYVSTFASCEEAAGTETYELRVPFEGELPAFASATEADSAGTRRRLFGRRTGPDSRIDGVEGYSFTSRHPADGEPDDPPAATFGEDSITIAGTVLVSSSSCVTADVSTFAYDADTASLLVDVDTGVPLPDSPEWGCTEDMAPETYELEVTFDGPVPDSVVVTEGAESILLERDADGASPTFTFASERTGPTGPDPSVRFEDDHVVVAGHIEVGSSSCGTVVPSTLSLDDEGSTLSLAVTDAANGPCVTDDVVGSTYELSMAFEDRPLPERVSVTENVFGVAETTTFERQPSGPVREGLEAHAYTRDARGLEATDRPEPTATIGADVAVVHGPTIEGPSNCSGQELAELAYDDESGLLSARVTEPRTYGTNEPIICTDDIASTSYELVAVADGGPIDRLALEDTASGDVSRQFEPADELPAVSGLEEYEFSRTQGVGPDGVEPDPTVRIEDGSLVVSGVMELPYLYSQYLALAVLSYDATFERLVVGVTVRREDEVAPPAAGFEAYEVSIPLEEVDPKRVTVVEAGEVESTITAVPRREIDEDEVGIDLGEYEARPYDGSDRYWDVDGSGTLGSNDVVTFFEHLESPAVRDNPAAFDFNGSGGVGFDDVVALFEYV